MPTEILVALMVFIGLLAISMMGYWSASRQADSLHRIKHERPLTSYESVAF